MLDGIFQHQDSNGGNGLISDGDIQWMTAVYSSSESLTGDLEAYDDDAGVLQVYDAQARYLPLTWQAPDPRRRWAGQARLGPPQQGQEDRLHDALRRFLPLSGRADLAEARSWTSRQQPKQSAINSVAVVPSKMAMAQQRAEGPRYRGP
jgi:hypothetical protein